MKRKPRKVREFSKKLLGGAYRLEVAAAIAKERGPFFEKALAAKLDLAEPLVHQELMKLIDVGLIRRLPRERGIQAKYLERLPSAYWGCATKMLAELTKGRL